ncbi:MAG TPA: hypothetical protein PLH72_05890 [Vicinamibacterales bacterium]|nr:hypothetical protein [Vicinamibacterales bacterium]
MWRCGVMGFIGCLLVLGSTDALAQPDGWVVQPLAGSVPPSVRVLDATNGSVQRQFDAPPMALGAELARAQFSWVSDFNPRALDIALVGDRVILIGGDNSPLVGGQQFVVTFDQETLSPGPSSFTPGEGLSRLDLAFRWNQEAESAWEAIGEVSVPAPPRLEVSAEPDGRFSLRWEPDASGPEPGGFEVRGGPAGQLLPVMTGVGSDIRAWTSPLLPAGAYSMEVVSTNAVGASAPSNRIDLSVGESAIPSEPQSLTSAIADDVVRLSWSPPTGGPVPGGYVVEAAPAGSAVFAPVPQVFVPELRVSSVPAGTWHARVRAVTAGGAGAPSDIVTITAVSCTTAPSAPSSLALMATGRLLTLQWTPPGIGGAAEYVVEAGTAPGLTNLARLGTGGSAPSFQSPVPAGVFFVRVRAKNACGESPPSNEKAVVVP